LNPVFHALQGGGEKLGVIFILHTKTFFKSGEKKMINEP